MIQRTLVTIICCGLSLSAGASKLRELDDLKDALPTNRFAIEVLIFVREPTIDATIEPLQKKPLLVWSEDLMALPTQLKLQRTKDSEQIWIANINNRYCFTESGAALPNFMNIVLANGFETELLNEFTPAGSQVTLIPRLNAAEANPLSVDPIDVYEPEPEGEPAPIITISAISRAEENFTRSLKNFNKGIYANSWQWLNEDHLALQQQRYNIGLAPELHVVFHGRWQQPVPARDAPQRILLPIQNSHLSSQLVRLNGHIGITLGRYLHANAKLWLQPDPSSDQYALLNESRRMRSNELHYLDHPLMGLLINIEPIEADAALDSSWQALQEAKTLASP